MADNVQIGNTPGTADYTVASEELTGGAHLQSVELYTESGGTKTKAPPLTDGQLRATAVPVSGPLTDAQIRATALPVSEAPVPLTAAAPGVATVGTGSADAVAANASRKGLVLTNLSDNSISLGFGQVAVLNAGITLLAQGGSWTMTRETFTTAAVRAIAAGAGSALAYQEFA